MILILITCTNVLMFCSVTIVVQLKFKRMLNVTNEEDWVESNNLYLTIMDFEKQVLVCFKLNMLDVPTNTWWLDTTATIHVTNLF